MARNTGKNKKESGDSGNAAPGRKKPIRAPSKKRGGGHNDDDSVDSRGNIRGLIAYSEEDDDSDYESSAESTLTPEERATVRRSARKAAVKARTNIRNSIENKRSSSKRDEEEEEDEEEEQEAPIVKRRNGFQPKKKQEESASSEEDEESASSEDDDEDDDDEEDEEDDVKKGRSGGQGPGISISFGGFDDGVQRMIPTRHNMKKESALVKKFVKLVTEPYEDGGIDEQIDQFKAMTEEKQKMLVETLEKKPAAAKENMMFKILTMDINPDTKSIILAKYNALQNMDPGSGDYFKHRGWLEKATSLPLGIYKEMPVRLGDGNEQCGGFMGKAKKCLDEAIYGQNESKLQILQFIASKIANPGACGLSLLLIGPPGIGKTSLIKNGIAKALNWPFQFISLGGDSDATTYTGHQLVYEGSHAGKIVNSVIAAKSMSMVMMFDELDKISATPKGEEVQNLMVHLTDATQNSDFEDKYLSGIPLDLSRIMFVFSGNDIGKIDKILLDRMTVIHLEGYDKKEKLAIAENFLLPGALKEVNLDEKVSIPKEILEHIITEYCDAEAGVRELKRCIEQITQKINMLRIFNTKELPFHIPEFQLPFVVKKNHIDLFLKKNKPKMDVSAQRMYT